jgi:hypothetical protein
LGKEFKSRHRGPSMDASYQVSVYLAKWFQRRRFFRNQEFVGLKSKMYSMISEEEGCLKEKKTAKGIKKSVIKHHTKQEHCKQCLFDKTIHMSTMDIIVSFKKTPLKVYHEMTLHVDLQHIYILQWP